MYRFKYSYPTQIIPTQLNSRSVFIFFFQQIDYMISSCDLLSFLLRRGIRLYALGIQRESNLLVKAGKSSLLTITPPEAPNYMISRN